MSTRSRLPGFYKYPVSERLRLLYEREIISEEDYHALMDGTHLLGTEEADRLVENVIGVYALPLGLGLNFVINGKPYVVPLVVEEPSILAALSAAAKLAAASGGFTTSSEESLLIGQVQVVDVPHPSTARNKILQMERKIVSLANSLHPKMAARGGGAKAVDVMIHPSASTSGDMLVVHLLVDTCDAMGANLVNTMCEGIAPLVEQITGGRVFLRILSNLTDRSMVRAEARFSVETLAGKGYTGEQVRDGIILANDFAMADPYRAATHNKGIMNGIDAVALATANDWRAIEAAAHAYAGRGMSYTSLTRWYKGASGDLVGRIELPLKVGIVGGQMQSNRSVRIAHRLLQVSSARELAEIMAAVGLAQNFAALRALSTEGIQRGHMSLHARSVAVAAGAGVDIFDTVIERLMESGEIKVWKAQEIIASLQRGGDGKAGTTPEEETEVKDSSYASAHAKVILLGEHAVVYGSHGIAAPIPLAIQARAEDSDDPGVELVIPRWGFKERLVGGEPAKTSIQQSLAHITRELGVAGERMRIMVYPHVPRAMGFGGSAALAVALIRAVARRYGKLITDEQVNDIAFQCETFAHGESSGIDNTLATFGEFIVFRKGDPPEIRPLKPARPLPLVVGISGVESLTAKMVGKVRAGWEKNKALYERIFNEIDGLALKGVEAIETGDLEQLGELMNICHGLLNTLQVSSWELEEMVEISRKSGALGAKLTGGGGGGSMVALCADRKAAERTADAIRQAGYRAILAEIGGR